MPKITFINHEGQSQTINATAGDSVMQAATDNSVDGIDADCGGACACATCHVYIDPQWLSQLEPQSDLERELLSETDAPQDNSRLCCQILVSEKLDGLVVTTPESQF